MYYVAGAPGSIPSWGVCNYDFFRFCQSFTSNFPFPFSFPSSSFPFLFLSLSFSLRPFVCAKKRIFAFIPCTMCTAAGELIWKAGWGQCQWVGHAHRPLLSTWCPERAQEKRSPMCLNDQSNSNTGVSTCIWKKIIAWADRVRTWLIFFPYLSYQPSLCGCSLIDLRRPGDNVSNFVASARRRPESSLCPCLLLSRESAWVPYSMHRMTE